VDRVQCMLDGCDLSSGVIEIGPLCSPIVQRSSGSVRYVDHLCTEDLRAKYADNPSVAQDRICEVDIVWPGTGKLDLSGFTAKTCVASHVIEHIPDPLRWLNHLSDALDSDGQIALAIPDKRYTFDVRRSETRPDEVLAAFIEERSTPSPAQIIGHGLFYSFSTLENLWNGIVDAQPVMDEVRTRWAYQLAADIFASGKYLDVHCWVWTPESFCEAIKIARWAGVLNLEVASLSDTSLGSFEFFARLRRA